MVGLCGVFGVEGLGLGSPALNFTILLLAGFLQ